MKRSKSRSNGVVKKPRIKVYETPRQWRRMERAARDNGMTLNQWINDAARRRLSKGPLHILITSKGAPNPVEFKIDPKWHQRLRRVATLNGMTLRAVVWRAITEFVAFEHEPEHLNNRKRFQSLPDERERRAFWRTPNAVRKQERQKAA